MDDSKANQCSSLKRSSATQISLYCQNLQLIGEFNHCNITKLLMENDLH